jgi:predicted RNase H-like HicB family nuclease/DNA-binding XRE family transcriptional regulator
MELVGKVWKSKKNWLIEVPSLDLVTQGHSRQNALEMMGDAILELLRSYFGVSKEFDVRVNYHKNNVIGVAAIDNTLLLALSLKRQREKSGSTIRESAKRLGTTPNAYAQYERGKTRFSLDYYEKLRQAANPYCDENIIRIT